MTNATSSNVGNLLSAMSNSLEVALCMDLGGADRAIEVKGAAGDLYDGLPEEVLFRPFSLIEIACDFSGDPYLSIDC